MFSYEYCKVCKDTRFEEHLQMTPSEYYSKGEVNVVKITQAKLQKMKSNVTVTSFLGLVSIFLLLKKKSSMFL